MCKERYKGRKEREFIPHWLNEEKGVKEKAINIKSNGLSKKWGKVLDL